MPLIILLVGITGCRYVHKPRSFPPNLFRRTMLQKFGRVNNCSWDYSLESRIFEENQQSAIQTEIELNFCGFFQQIKVRQPIGRKDSIQTMIPTSRIFVWSGSELWTLLKYSRSKLKNQKHIAVDVLFKAYLMIPLSGWSNLAGRYL